MPYRTAMGNRLIAGIQVGVAVAALAFGWGTSGASPIGTLSVITTILLSLLALASSYYLATGRSEGDMAVRGVRNPRLTRTLGFIAAATFAIVFIITAVFSGDGQPARDSILLNGLWGYLFISSLSTATIAQAQLMRERSDASSSA